MFIKDVTIQGFRPFGGPSTFQLSRQISVIAGINGCGKTAILDAIALSLSRLIPQFTSARRQARRFKPSDVHQGAREAIITTRLDPQTIPIRAFKVCYSLDKGSQYTRLDSTTRNQIRGRYAELGSPPIAVYYTTDRAAFRGAAAVPVLASSNKAMSAYKGALTRRIVSYGDLMVRLESKLKYLKSTSRDNPSYFGHRVASTIQSALSRFLGGFENLRVEVDPLRLMVDKRIGGNSFKVDISGLSDGERAFLAMICDLCRRMALVNPDSATVLQTPGVVLIDELEMHLHPTWQREAISKFRETFPNIQFIMSTHSPFVIQNLQPGELVMMDDVFKASYAGQGLEEVARYIMHVEHPEMSLRYREMLNVAKEYFELLDRAEDKDERYRIRLRERLTEMSAPYANNPAYHAFLQQRRIASGL